MSEREDVFPEHTQRNAPSKSRVGEAGAAFDRCAISGNGPFQEDADRWYGDFFREALQLDDDICSESHFWCFMRDRYAWAILEHEALSHIASRHVGQKVIDIGAGSGYVAACLAARGCDVTAVHLEDTWTGWWRTRFLATKNTPASALRYDASAYLLLMPDGSGGEDMMYEALSRMPLGSVAYVHAPAECSGSLDGSGYLQCAFEKTGDLPLLNCFPFEDAGREVGIYRKAREPAGEDVRAATEAVRATLPSWRMGVAARQRAALSEGDV
jgi:SAM-dependent methyltransferase